MDNRRLVIGMLVAMAVMMLWPQIVFFVGTQLGYDMRPKPAPTTQRAPGAGTTTMPSTAAAESSSPSGTAPSMASASGLRIAPATQPAVPVQIGSASENDPKYKMALRIVPRGAGLDSVALNEFKMAAQGKEPYTFQQPYPGAAAISRPMATRSLTLDGATIDLSSADWALDASDERSASYSVTVVNDSGPIARVRKVYQLSPSSDLAQGYEIAVTQTIENLTDRPLKIQAMFNGPTLPPREQDRGGERQILAGYAAKSSVGFTYDMIESFSKEKPTKDYTKDKEGNPLIWIGGSSIYFNALVHPLPLPTDDPKFPAKFIEKVTATTINPDATPEEHQIVIDFTTSDLTVSPGQSVTLPLRAYLGPRQRKVLNSDYYTAAPLGYNQTLVLTSGPCGFCTFQWLINLLVILLRGFHWVFGGFARHGDWGLAIIALVVLVRAILHPITKKSQISMSKMSKMGPEMERLKQKYGDNKEELNKAMMGFYKEQGITPILGCLPMFLQMPIWIALWQSLQTTFELRHAPFLWGFTWIHDLSKPDHLLEWPPIPLIFGWHLAALNLLPLLMAAVFWLQMKFQPQPAAMTPEQKQQQKMMLWMTVLLFPLMLYTGPSGLNLYILTSTAIGIVESKIVRDHIKQREEAEKAGRVIVDPGKKFKGGGGGSGIKKSGDRPKPGGLMGWLEEIQKKRK
jgi:YidC/Oxa1 family membrane protein insertase